MPRPPRTGREFRDRALVKLEADGVDVADAAHLLLALRRRGAAAIERLVNLKPAGDVGRLELWKSRRVREVAEALRVDLPPLKGVRVVLAVLEVHDLMRDAIAKALPTVGAEVVLLGADASVEAVAQAAVDEDAHAMIVAVYNGNALDLARRLVTAATALGYEGRIVFGGLLNQDFGDGLPVDVRPQLAELGVTCLDRADQLGPALAELAAA